MSILTGFKKVKNYILTSSGYQLLSRWTSSQTVEFDDGKTAQTKLGEINGIAKTYVDMKKATDNSMAASAKAVMEGLENSSALISMTQAEYDALSDEEKTDNNMRAILDANPDVVDAKNVNYDNTNTNLTATTTQDAITELNGKLQLTANDITTLNSELSVIGDISETTVSLNIVAATNQETEYTLIDGLPNGTYMISAFTHVDNAPIPTGFRLFAAIESRSYLGATNIAGNSQTWQWTQTIFFKGTKCVIRFLPEFDFNGSLSMSLLLIRIR